MLQAQRTELRPLLREDFDEAIKEVAPASADRNSDGMNELMEWNAKYGEGADRTHRLQLSYFV